MNIRSLQSFPKIEGLPRDEREIRRALHSGVIKGVVLCALGPEGTNIEEASRLWAVDMNLADRSQVILCNTPWEALNVAREIKDPGLLGIFWSCAVYFDEARLFFQNPDVLPFFFIQVMNLDEMQLACRPESAAQIVEGEIPPKWRITSHPSPQYLLGEELMTQVVCANSNAYAALMCRQGEVEACMTTERARVLSGLTKIHSFGSPPMVFFGGITESGIELMRQAHKAASEKSIYTI